MNSSPLIVQGGIAQLGEQPETEVPKYLAHRLSEGPAFDPQCPHVCTSHVLFFLF